MLFDSVKKVMTAFKPENRQNYMVKNKVTGEIRTIDDFAKEKRAFTAVCWSKSEEKLFCGPFQRADPVNKRFASRTPRLWDFVECNLENIGEIEYELVLSKRKRELEDAPESKKQKTEEDVYKDKISEFLREFKEKIEENCKNKGKHRVATLRAMIREAVKGLDSDWGKETIQKSRKWNKKELCKWLSFHDEVALDEVPEYFLCPVFLTIMTDPVMLPSGQAISREAFNDKKLIQNPFTRKAIPENFKVNPIPNLFLKEKVEEWIVEHAAYNLHK